MKENKMGVMPVPRLVISMSVPLMISLLVQSLYNIVDGIFVARLSEAALTAVSIAYSAQMLQIAASVGTAVGINALISRRLGAKQPREAGEAATTGLLLSIATSLLFILWGAFGSGPFIRLFSQNGEIVTMGTEYLRICQLWAMGIFLGTTFQRILQATGRTGLSMLTMFIGAGANMILDPIMIFGLLGCPAMGVRGAAIATVIGQWLTAVSAWLLHVTLNRDLHLVIRGYRLRLRDVADIYKVGLPTILTQSFSSLQVAFMNRILVGYSDTAVAFFGVYFKLQNFLYMPMNGLGQGALPIVGYNFGAKRGDRIRSAFKTALLFAVGIALCGTLLFLLLPGQLLGFFSAGSTMLSIGVPALRIICLVFPVGAAVIVIGYTASGLGNGMTNMLCNLLRHLLVLIPCALLLGHLWGLSGIWYAYWIAELSAAVLAVVLLKREFRKKVNPLS